MPRRWASTASYRQVPLWLDKDELAGLISDVRSAILSRLNNKPDNKLAPDRGLYLLSPIVFPIEELPQRRADQ